MAKAKKKEDESVDLQKKIDELTNDLQRTRADFENFRKRVDGEKQQAMKNGETKTALKILPVVDTIERAVVNIPQDIADNAWAKGVSGMIKQLEVALSNMGIKKIDAKPGVTFDPELHQAVQFDEEADGDTEVISEELQAGYTLDGMPIRHSMVKVTRK